ncbi:MAG: phosphoribosylformylglycinamidine synthase [Candidatus Magasanikbacteria bacterium CG_4_10_14_0_2_um_filter_37_12]|uniref:Phosphoribosylformylglycinamidine synthase n=1 Tax=Candidatus Magasanikbacteria bacterium CG_4_10_14_0_2_um_filter_37_12 TaxID=1974637 RepID=A0A2M7V9A7_9BACT|nr:MAG: phosphoribosylformylglycinamidine synthase [Candidatus Magasanikbacteria bacterium CG_4_10_14_0_2_um_filter_37_12]
MFHFYRKISPDREDCFNIDTTSALNVQELQTLTWLLAETFEPENFSQSSFFLSNKNNVLEIGPRLNFETPFSTNAVAICHSCGLGKITRIERSRRYLLAENIDRKEFLTNHHDKMVECKYTEPLQSFATNIVPGQVVEIDLIGGGVEKLEKINKEMGLGMDEWDINFYHNLFKNEIGRNPTNVECFQLGQANSEHSRHWFFKGQMNIDGEKMPESLFEIIQSTLKANPRDSVIAFKDNSSGIEGQIIKTLLPEFPGKPSRTKEQECQYHIIFTAETHNFPCGVAPFPGGETGTGGRIRDTHATGQGSLVVAGTAGFCVGNLSLSGYTIPGEEKFDFEYPSNFASPLRILIEESSGAYDYANKFGEPCVQGFTRTFGTKLLDGSRREWIKPIMFTGGIGQIDSQHTEKDTPKKNMLVVQIGGPAYKIGAGGGAASSMIQGENKEELDFNAVQRGDAEMEQKTNRVIRACVEMGDKNPILSIHDQGAGGPCNVITEIVDPAGGEIDVRRIKVGDQTMSVLELWSAEYQERDALLISTGRIYQFQQICLREKVNCEVLGEITESGKIVLIDSKDNSKPVDLDLKKILGKMPKKKFISVHKNKRLDPLKLPEDLSVAEMVEKVFALPSVGSKGFLVRKVDRSVTGLIVQQQCCGPLQLPVADVAVIAQSHFSQSGGATAIGEQPIKMLVNAPAGARMALGEMLTNMVWARVKSIDTIKCAVNWMWAAKLDGEGAELYDAAVALRDLMMTVGIGADGGKDSLSMAAKAGEEIVKAPGQMVVSGYASVPDISKVITPDLKKPGQSSLLFINLSGGKNRMGGSALAQVCGQIGDVVPDVDNSELLKNGFLAVQKLIDQNLILSGHDRSDGGLITTLFEMAMSGNCGFDLKLNGKYEIISQLFSEELGLVIEYRSADEVKISQILQEFYLPCAFLGFTKKERRCLIRHHDKVVLDIETNLALQWWEATSDRLEEEQIDAKFAREQSIRHDRPFGPQYKLSFQPVETAEKYLQNSTRPKVAIIREEGSNGDREMTSAFYTAGFEPWDVMMSDLKNGCITLEQFRGVAFVGGFSYGDVLDSAKGWAGTIRFNTDLQKIFTDFYHRSDTFSLAVCNGCQLSALLGWVPGKAIDESKQPRFVHNASGRFESRWIQIKILESPAIMLKGMAGSSLGIWVAHGEGRLHLPDQRMLSYIKNKKLVPLVYTDDSGQATKKYPFNPNGSPAGIAGICSPDGRHLAMMPHPERVFLKWQWPWMPDDFKKLKTSPWLKMFQNAREWCD